MNINGFISKEELEKVKLILKNGYNGTKGFLFLKNNVAFCGKICYIQIVFIKIH